MSNGRGGTWGASSAPTSGGGGSYEYADHVLKEPHGPTYDMVTSEKDASIRDPQDPHFLGQLMPVAHSRSEEVRSFFDATSITG
jgi:hypothetical protein